MKKIIKIILWVLLGLTIIGLGINLMSGGNIDIFNPMGTIAKQQRDLIVLTCLLALIVVVPVFTMLIVFAWRYRDTNTKRKAKYTPDKAENPLLEIIWWGIPILIIIVLGTVTVITSHTLDPYRPLESKVKPVKIQVVALQWKWLFIYPEQQIASVNLVEFPVHTPVNFEITADAPMNSFWIPSLAGQIYAMTGMSTKLHIEADKAGDYKGSSANISGEGFASMRFTARAASRADFDAWVTKLKQSDTALTLDLYNKLAKPGTVDKPKLYQLADKNLYDSIVMKYMVMPDTKSQSSDGTTKSMDHMNMEGM